MRSSFHYGWVVLTVSTLTVMGGIGFARFGYTAILPEMQTALDLNNTQTGGLATGNFVGYLVLGVVGGAGLCDVVLWSGAGGRAERRRCPCGCDGLVPSGFPGGGGRGLSGRGGFVAAATA